MAPPLPPDNAEAIDGRRLRRVRGREAVMDAVIELRLGESSITVERLCATAGISEASLFRYFANLDELRAATIRHWFSRTDHLLAIPCIGSGSNAQRIQRFVSARDSFYRETAPMARFARRQALQVEELAAALANVRAIMADQISQQFALELGPLAARERRERVALLAAISSFESWEQLAALGDASRRRALRAGIHRLLPAS